MALLLPFRSVGYHLDGLFDLMNMGSCDFSMNAETYTAFTANGKEYSIFDREYWDKQWKHWRESKKLGKNYYADVANLLNKSSKRIFEIGCGPGYLIESIYPLYRHRFIL